jgi:transcriptional regulator with XRE-family HTH domain
VATRERTLDRARHRGAQALVRIGDELRDARVAANLTQTELGAVVGISGSELSRIEHGQAAWVSYLTLGMIAAALGLDLSVRTFPAGDAVRDGAQLALLARFRARLGSLRHVPEVGLPRAGDLRAWDEVAFGAAWSIPVDAESRLRDVQAVARRASLKLRDSGFDRMILLLADTRHNRHVLRLAGDSLSGAFPVPGRHALASLERGRCPAGSAIVVL